VLRKILILALSLAIAGCSKQQLLQKFTTPQEQAAAQGYIDLLGHQQYEAIEKAMDPSIAGPSIHQTLEAMAELIPNSKPISIMLIGAQRFKTADYSTINLSFEYQYPAKWLVTNIAFKQQGNVRTIVGFHVYPQQTSLEERYKFRLAGKSALQYTVLALAILVPLFVVFTLVVCIQTKLRKRKWLWVLFILLGFGRLAVNWTTGEWSLGLLSFQLFGASAAADLYGPWFVAVSAPIGAIVFLLKKRALSVPVSPS
jgi:hypothetical protein